MASSVANVTNTGQQQPAPSTNTMRAAVYERYGPPEVVHVRTVATPVPRENEVRIRVHATTVAAADWRMRKADPSLIRIMNGLSHPKKAKILGMEFSGEVDSVGAAVTRFHPGDEVFASSGFKFGGHAEYVCVPEDGIIAMKPANITFEQAAAVLFGGISALHFLRKACVEGGQKVLVYGASGSVGVFAVQLAKHFGAYVVGVCSTPNMEMVKSLGADEVIDYTKQDFSTTGQIYDVVFDTVGKSGFSRSLKCLRRGGAYVRVGGSGHLVDMLADLVKGTWVSVTGAAKVISGVAAAQPGDAAFLAGLMERGELRTVIDRRYALDGIAEAHRYAEGGHKKGHVVVFM